MRRLQPPFAGIPMIVTFGPSIDIINGDLPTERGVFRSFLAGLHDVHVLTEYEGEQTGFQVNSPCSAPIASSTSRCPTSPIAASISATCWATRRPTSLSVHCRIRPTGRRADLMDRFLLERLRRGRPMSPDVAWALKSLQASHGARSRSAGSAAISNAAARPSSASMPRWA